MGFAAFAINLNVEALSSDWAETCAQRLFDAAKDADFKCFISMDLNEASDKQRDKFTAYVNKFIGHDAYYRHDDKPFLSTFSVGDTHPARWTDFLAGLNDSHGVYFVPEPDNYEGYYAFGQPEGTAAFWDAWAPVVDGVFSWETAWTKDGKSNVSTADWDEPHARAAHRRNRTYMVPMSSLQYKHWVTADRTDNWYRAGEVALPQRMAEVLAMDPAPDFAEVITWNDAGESHYIGAVHPEGELPQFKEYANDDVYDHTAWQRLYRAFIDADARGMRPPDGQKYVGALWYRAVTTDARCADRPAGADTARDAVNYAVVVAEGVENAYVQVYSGGRALAERVPLGPGLNYGSVPGLGPGRQYLEVVEIDGDGTWTYQYTKTGAVEVVDDTHGGLCNYNYLVYGLEAGKGH